MNEQPSFNQNIQALHLMTSVELSKIGTSGVTSPVPLVVWLIIVPLISWYIIKVTFCLLEYLILQPEFKKQWVKSTF